ncbi:MAG: helix-turn-helix domain-containing protein [Bacteroidetes bacterium]|nr:helix-turn-helix domain-containing protein [Bacteroidota bacterium]
MPTFAELLRGYRGRTGLSQRALARASEINPAIISRLESGDRAPSGPEQVLAITRALALDDLSADRLLASAGYWPRAVLALGPQDETLLTLARVLADGRLDRQARIRFRHILQLLAEQWMAGEK